MDVQETVIKGRAIVARFKHYATYEDMDELVDLFEVLADHVNPPDQLHFGLARGAQAPPRVCAGSGQPWTNGTGDRACPMCAMTAVRIVHATGMPAMAHAVPQHHVLP